MTLSNKRITGTKGNLISSGVYRPLCLFLAITEFTEVSPVMFFIFLVSTLRGVRRLQSQFFSKGSLDVGLRNLRKLILKWSSSPVSWQVRSSCPLWFRTTLLKVHKDTPTLDMLRIPSLPTTTSPILPEIYGGRPILTLKWGSRLLLRPSKIWSLNQCQNLLWHCYRTCHLMLLFVMKW